MNKYPVLSGVSVLARIVGWVLLIISGIMCLIGFVQTIGSIPSAANNPYRSNPLDLYQGVSLLVGGGSMLVLSLILILVGEIISVLARIFGWVLLIISGIMCLIWLVQTIGSIPSAANNPYRSNPLDLYQGVSLLVGGGSMLVLSLILILVGEIIKVFTDMEHGISNTVKLLGQLKGASLSGTVAETSSFPTTPPIPIMSSEEQEIIFLAEKAGFSVRIDGTRTIFERHGVQSYRHDLAGLQEFRRKHNL